MKKHQKENRQFLAELEAFKRRLLNHRNGITTGWKRVSNLSRDNTTARESILEENLADKCELEPTSLLLPEQRVQSEETTVVFQKFARIERLDAGLLATEGMGRNRD